MKQANTLLLFLLTFNIFGQVGFKFEVMHKAGRALDGRLLVLISKEENPEPRFAIRDDYKTQQIFGTDVAKWATASTKLFPSAATYHGYPIQKFDQLEEGWYYVQAMINIYETYNLSTGHTVQLPPDRGEGQQWNRKPGNLYSKVQKVYIEPKKPRVVSILLDQEIPAIEEPQDTRYIKHIKMRSKLLSDFWGTDVFLGAHVLVPHNFEKDHDMKYPLMIYHGHFPSDFGGFSTEPPPANMDTSDYSERFKMYGYKKFQMQEAYNFYSKWTSDTFPRYIVIEIQHPTPYYDDSYAVNSACQGPYGDAITYELIPFIEEKFRGIGQGWARFLYGGSTGGWEALAAQLFYPEEYNGCFAACPDPIDFRAYTVVNIYEDDNAYVQQGPYSTVERPGKRDYLGHVSTTLRHANQYELALGTKSRSGQQWDIWEATYSPMDKEGYPQRIWDKETGKINKEVAKYWKENFDLGHIIKRDWSKIGKSLEGKIHIYCGDMDNYYLNNAVYLVEEILNETKNPYYKGEVTYGDRAEHCWNGDPTLPNHVTRLRYNTMYLPRIIQRIKDSAPKGADLRFLNED
ncbi:MAG TPA: alpha/beta hydrolase-fold protein [Saprospiraceae bacterium]|nr:alpha/beta hydrolase-fold protein [Saprospiraceae bacterium]